MTRKSSNCVFGRATERLVISEEKLLEITKTVNKQMAADTLGGVADKSMINRLRRDEALMDLALAVAMGGVAPRKCLLWNEHHSGGAIYRVRRVSKTGDIWVDKSTPEGKWNYRHFQGDVLYALAEIHPQMSSEDIRTKSGFRRMISFLLYINEAAGGRITSPSVKSLYSRLGCLRLMAKHGGIGIQTRVLLALIWSGGQGKLERVSAGSDITSIIIAAAGLPVHTTRAVKDTLSCIKPEILQAYGRRMSCTEWAAWTGGIVSALQRQNKAARFRVFWMAWYKCLTNERGSWRWRGFHHLAIPGGIRDDAKVAARLSHLVGVCKKTSAVAIEILTQTGLLITAGDAICLGCGIWAEKLSNNIKMAMPTASKYLTKILTGIRRNYEQQNLFTLHQPKTAIP